MDELKLQLQVDRKNTQYNETQKAATNARSKMYFSRHSQGCRFIAYLIKLQSSSGRGEGGPIYGKYGYVYQPLASLTLEQGIKIALHFLVD